MDVQSGIQGGGEMPAALITCQRCWPFAPRCGLKWQSRFFASASHRAMGLVWGAGPWARHPREPVS